MEEDNGPGPILHSRGVHHVYEGQAQSQQSCQEGFWIGPLGPWFERVETSSTESTAKLLEQRTPGVGRGS